MSRSNLRRSGNILLLLVLIAGVAVLKDQSAVVRTLIGTASIALSVLAGWGLSLLTKDDQERARIFLERSSFTWALLAAGLMIWAVNALLLDFPSRITDALVGRKRIVVQIVPGEGLIQLLGGLKRRGDVTIPLVVHVQDGKAYSKEIGSAGIVYTGASETKLKETAATMMTDPPNEAKRELMDYLKTLNVPIDKVGSIVNAWSEAEFLPTENLRANDVVDVWLGCEGGKAWMVKTGPKVLSKKDVYPIYLEVEGNNPCARTN